MSEITFFIEGIPQPWKETQFTKAGRAYSPAANKRWKEAILVQALLHKPPEPFDCPLRVDLHFCFPFPKSWPQWKVRWALERIAVQQLVPYLAKDRDNLMKPVFDALEGTFWVNDNRVVTGDVTKCYAAVPGIEITIIPLWPLPKRKSDLKERK